jgi:hypothetical protein
MPRSIEETVMSRMLLKQNHMNSLTTLPRYPHGCLFVFLILMLPKWGTACSCIDVWEAWGVEATVNRAEWVFVGKAIGPRTALETEVITGEFLDLGSSQEFQVLQAGKGPQIGDTVKLYSPALNSTCGVSFPENVSFLFVSKMSGGLQSIGLCDGPLIVEDDPDFVAQVLGVADGSLGIDPSAHPRGLAHPKNHFLPTLRAGRTLGSMCIDGRAPQ